MYLVCLSMNNISIPSIITKPFSYLISKFLQFQYKEHVYFSSFFLQSIPSIYYFSQQKSQEVDSHPW